MPPDPQIAAKPPPPRWATRTPQTRESARRSRPDARAPIQALARSLLFPNDLDQSTFLAPAIELAIKNLLPRSEVELAVRNRDHHLPPHHLPLQMSIGIVLARAIMQVLRRRLMRSQFLEPFVVIGMQA